MQPSELVRSNFDSFSFGTGGCPFACWLVEPAELVDAEEDLGGEREALLGLSCRSLRTGYTC